METFLPEVMSGGMLLITMALYKFFQVVAKMIPDDAAGIAGIVRRIAKVMSLYTVNRKTSVD